MSITIQSAYPALNRLRIGRDLPFLPLAILVPFVLIAVFANVIAPYDPTEPIPGAKIFEPPVWSSGGSLHALLGTDYQSRDVLSRLIFGARVSLIVGVMGTVVAGGIGTTLGMLAGYIGGWVDQVIMRVTDAWLALPAIVFAIFLATMVGPSMWNIVIILGCVYWTRYARVIRGEVLSLREREFVKLAEIAGASRTRVILRHILPNVMNSTMVLASLTIGVVIIAEASLSFLGVGVPPPRAGLGVDAGRRALDADGRRLVADDLPGSRHSAGRARDAAVRRLAAHPARSAAAEFVNGSRDPLPNPPPLRGRGRFGAPSPAQRGELGRGCRATHPTHPMTPLLEVTDLRTHFTSFGGTRVVKAVDGISFTLNDGETLGLIGESGCGKTTTCLSIVGLLPNSARIAGGRIAFQGEELTQKSSREMRRIRGRMIAHDPAGSDGLAEPAVQHLSPGRRARLLPSVDARPRACAHGCRTCCARCAFRRRRSACATTRTR